MKRIEKLRNLGIMAHVDAGKTTLTERALFYAGATYKIGDVDDGNTTMDKDKQEQKRGITISSAAITASWTAPSPETGKPTAYQFNLIDTPGHVDFTAEVERSLRVLDGAVALFCAVAGVQPQSETVWRQADKYGVPRICYINKMDREGADFQRVVEQIRSRMNQQLLVLQLPIGAGKEFAGLMDLVRMEALYWNQSDQGKTWESKAIPAELLEQAEAARLELLENLAEWDEQLMEKFLESPESISELEIKQALRKATLSGEASPVLCGTAKMNIGVQPLLDMAVTALPGPADREKLEATQPETGESLELTVSEAEPFSGLVFKLVTDDYLGRIAMVRIYTGTLSKGSQVLNVRTGKNLKIGRLLRIRSDQMAPLELAEAGEICALVGLKDLRTGDTLSDAAHPVLLESMDFPEPVIGYAIEARTGKDSAKLGKALSQLQDEDPTLRVNADPVTGQTVLLGMGELHLEVVLERIRSDHKVDVNAGAPLIAYREQFQHSIVLRKVLKKQTGGSGQFADIQFELGPRTDGETGLEFVDEIKGGAIPREFISSVEKGFRNAMETGVRAGYPVESMRVRLFDGSVHEKDSSAGDFELVASMAFREAANQCEVKLLEPVMKVTVECPEEFNGPVLSDLNRRRGLVTEIEARPHLQVLNAEVPLQELFGYITDLRTLSSGRASMSMEFARYGLVPENVAETVSV